MAQKKKPSLQEIKVAHMVPSSELMEQLARVMPACQAAYGDFGREVVKERGSNVWNLGDDSDPTDFHPLAQALSRVSSRLGWLQGSFIYGEPQRSGRPTPPSLDRLRRETESVAAAVQDLWRILGASEESSCVCKTCKNA